MSWPPPDLVLVLESMSIVDLREAIHRQTGQTPKNRADALRLAATDGARTRAIYEQNQLLILRPAVTWFRKRGEGRAAPRVDLERLDVLGGQIRGRSAEVWSRVVDGNPVTRVAYVDGIDYPPPDFRETQRIGFATIVWRRLRQVDVMEVHCKSQALSKVLDALTVAGERFKVLDFRENKVVDDIRRSLDAVLCEAGAVDDAPQSIVDTLRFTARPNADLAGKGAPFGPGGAYSKLPGNGRTLEVRGLKFRISQHDYSVVFYDRVSFDESAEFFSHASTFGDWVPYV